MAASGVALLAPWLATLHELHIRPIATDEYVSFYPVSTAGLWLRFKFPNDKGRSQMTRWIEALELVALFALAHPMEWLAVNPLFPSTDTERIAAEWKKLLEQRSPPQVLGYELDCTHEDEVGVLCDYLNSSETTEDALSPEYYAVRETFEALLEPSVHVEVPVRLRLGINAKWPTVGIAALPSFAALTTLRHDLSTEDGARTSRLANMRSRIREVHDPRFAVTSVTEELLANMRKIWASGIRVFDFSCMKLSMRDNPSLYVNALHELFGVERDGTIRNVLVGDLVDQIVAPAFLSALASSTSVREVFFESARFGSHQERQREFQYGLQWLAYAFFSRHADNALAKICIGCRCLPAEHVAAMCEVLEVDDPLTVLLPRLAWSIREHRDLRVSTTRVALDDPTTSNITALDVVASNMRVLAQEGEWWCVLLPSWGPAWVHEEQAMVSEVLVDEQTRANSVRPSVMVELRDIQPWNQEPLMRLLRLSGKTIIAVKIDAPCEAAVLDACPELEELVSLSGTADELSICPTFFTQRRCPRLKTLVIRMGILPDPGLLELEHLFHVLAINEHPMTQQLDRLFFSAVSYVNDFGDDSRVLNAALEMLTSNETLTNLTLRLPPTVRNAAGVNRLLSGFASHHKVELRTAYRLGRREKAAFLSVTSTHSTATPALLKQLDRRIVSFILAFVPDRRHRLIEVTIPELRF